MHEVVNKAATAVGLGGLAMLCGVTAACSKVYWVKTGSSAQEFDSKERVCLQEPTKRLYGDCMYEAGWTRIKSSRQPPDGYRGYPDRIGWVFRPLQ